MLYSLFILLVPVIYEKYDKGARLARALREVRVGFILSGAGTAVSLLIAYVPRRILLYMEVCILMTVLAS